VSGRVRDAIGARWLGNQHAPPRTSLAAPESVTSTKSDRKENVDGDRCGRRELAGTSATPLTVASIFARRTTDERDGPDSQLAERLGEDPASRSLEVAERSASRAGAFNGLARSDKP
jgi:hypothetical protein